MLRNLSSESSQYYSVSAAFSPPLSWPAPPPLTLLLHVNVLNTSLYPPDLSFLTTQSLLTRLLSDSTVSTDLKSAGVIEGK